MRYRARHLAAAALLAAACGHSQPGLADVSIVQLYSSRDGEYQAILLEDDAADGIDRFRGLTLVAHDAEGGSRVHTLAAGRVHEPAVDVHGRRRFLVATPSLGAWFRAQAELPEAFLDTSGGEVTIFGASRGATRRYPALDEDGAIAFEPASGRAVRSNYALSVHPRAVSDATDADFFAQPAPAVLVREYRSVFGERYRLAVLQREKSDLDTGREPGWRRTGRYFRTLDPHSPASPHAVPVCRYYLPPPHGDTYFFSADASECASLGHAIPGAILETAEAFRVTLPDAATGACRSDVSPAALQPLYRSWNGLAHANHRYTTNLGEHLDMLDRGWIGEGAGALGTAMCVDAFEMPVVKVGKQKPRIGRCADCTPR